MGVGGWVDWWVLVGGFESHPAPHQDPAVLASYIPTKLGALNKRACAQKQTDRQAGRQTHAHAYIHMHTRVVVVV